MESIVENRIKGVFIWIIGLMFFTIYLIEVLFYNNRFPSTISKIYLVINLLIIVMGFYIFTLKRLPALLENVLASFFGFILATIVVFYTNGIFSYYFPCIYLMNLTYFSFCRSKKGLITVNTFVFATIVYWILTIDSFIYFTRIQFLLNIIIYMLILIILRNYPFDCLSCQLDKKDCAYRSTCSIGKMETWKHQSLGDELNVKLFKKSR